MAALRFPLPGRRRPSLVHGPSVGREQAPRRRAAPFLTLFDLGIPVLFTLNRDRLRDSGTGRGQRPRQGGNRDQDVEK
jgi:hypothetical protein